MRQGKKFLSRRRDEEDGQASPYSSMAQNSPTIGKFRDSLSVDLLDRFDAVLSEVTGGESSRGPLECEEVSQQSGGITESEPK